MSQAGIFLRTYFVTLLSVGAGDVSFSEWRQRLRFLHAIMKLEQGKSVHEVAFDVGYSSVSAFITMFQQISGTIPERF